MKLWVIAALGALAVVAPAQLSYTFDSNNQGWQRGNLNTATYALELSGPATWNAAGYIDGPDFDAYAFHVSPLMTGSQEYAYGHALSFDYRSDFTDNVSYPLVVLGNGTQAIFQSSIEPGDAVFHHHAYNLAAGNGWVYFDGTNASLASETNIRHVLSTMTYFGMSADQHSGEDYTAVDNISVVPEPASLLAVATGIVALIRRRKH